MRKVKPIPVADLIAALPQEEQAAIAAGAKTLIAREHALRAVRSAAGRTQVDLAKRMGVSQAEVSRMEGGGDLMLSNFHRYLAAAGFKVELVAADGFRFALAPPADGEGGPRREKRSALRA